MTRLWFTRRPRRHRGPRPSIRAWFKAEWDAWDLEDLPGLLYLPRAVLGSGVLALALVAVSLFVPGWLLGVATGMPLAAAVAVWVVALVGLIIGHPLLRVPFRRPWLVVAIRADQDWADRSAWHVRGWHRSRRAVDAVADVVQTGRGPYLSAEFLL